MNPRRPLPPQSPQVSSSSLSRKFEADWLRGDISIFEVLRTDWDDLFRQLRSIEPFAHFDWITAYGVAFETRSKFATIVIRNSGGLKGILPFVEQSHCLRGVPAKTFRSLSGKHSCRFDMVASEHDREQIAALIWNTLRANPNWDVIEALDVPDGATFEDVVAYAKSDGYLIAKWPTLLSPYLEIPTDGTDPFANCPEKHKHVRKRLNKALKRLQAQGNMWLEVTTTDATEAMQRFIALESSGWKGAQGSAIGSRSESREFYFRIAESFSRIGCLRIYTLWLNDTPVSMELGLVHRGRYFSPKAAYNEAFSSFSPGHLLTRHIIIDLAQKNIGRYDFLGPRSRYKTVWAGEVRPHAHYRIFRPSTAGRIRHFIADSIAPLARQAKYAIRGDPQGLAGDEYLLPRRLNYPSQSR